MQDKIKRALLVCAIVIVAVIGVMFITTPTTHAAYNFTVAIHPGHGPSSSGTGTSGTITNGAKLSEAVQDEIAAQKLYEALTAAGIRAYITNRMTLYSSTPAALQAAPANGTTYSYQYELLPAVNTPWTVNSSYTTIPNLAIALHHNSTGDISVNGYEVYYSSHTGGNDDNSINYGKDAATVTKETAFANMVDSQLNLVSSTYLARRPNAVRSLEAYNVPNSLLAYSKVPAILVEAGYMSNQGDLAKMANSNNYNILAACITNAVKQYMQAYPPESTPPTLNKVSIWQTPTYQSNFGLIADVTDPSGVRSVDFEVYYPGIGESTLKKYAGIDNGNGTWSLSANIADFGNINGDYRVNIYATDNFGNRGYLDYSIINVMPDTTMPTATGMSLSPSPCYQNTFTATASGVTDTQSGISSVKFYVWTENGGQDDLKTYTAAANGSTWTASISKANHNNETGTYIVHAYGYDKRGNSALLGYSTVTVDTDTTAPTVGSITTSSSPTYADNFTVSANNVADDKSGVKNITFYVWSKSDRSDMKTYTGTKSGSNYSVNVKKSNHNNNVGQYIIHVYGTDNVGNSVFLGWTTVTLLEDKAIPTVNSLSTGGATADYTFTITANVTDENAVTNVRYAVWCAASGQDDLKWYAASNTSGNIWQSTVKYTDHFKQTGTYYVHAYTTDQFGNTGLAATAAINVTGDVVAPTITETTSPSDVPNRTFTVSTTNVSDGTNPYDSGVAKVRYAVWNENYGQRSMAWYDAANISGTNNYSATINIANHMNGTGKYIIHTYTYDKQGNSALRAVSTTNVSLDLNPPTITSLATNAAEVDYDFTVSAQATDPNGVKSIYFAVWSVVSGQSDLKWYQGVKSGDTWSAHVSFADHAYHQGTYVIHAYAQDNIGNDGFSAATSVVVKGDSHAPTISSYTIPSSTAERTFTMTANGVTDGADTYVSGISAVKFAVWNVAYGQATLRWYEGKNIPGTSNYTATADIANHMNGPGQYIVHIYTYDKAGNSALCAATTVNMTADVTAPQITSLSPSTSEVDYEFTVSAAAEDPSGVSSVRFAVWSAVNGQDDIKWYNAVNTSGNNWQATIKYTDHLKSTGTYYIHAFGKDAKGNEALGATTSVTVKGDKVAPAITGVNAPVSTLDRTFNVEVQGVSDGTSPYASGVDKVRMAVWNASAGQSTMQWYTAANISGTQNYSATVDVANHAYGVGQYLVHVYTYDKAGNSTLVRAISVYANGDFGVPTLNSVTNPSSGEYTFDVTANVSDITGVSSVQFQVYNEKQTAVAAKTYYPQADGSGNYNATINYAYHNNATGKYIVNIYATDGAGNRGMIGSTSATITGDKTGPTSTGVVPTLATYTVPDFRIRAAQVSDLSGVKRVEFAVWSSFGGQDDLRWYEGVNIDGQNWDMTSSIVNHRYDIGTYNVHAYATDSLGNRALIGTASFQVTADAVLSIGYGIMGPSNVTQQQMLSQYASKGYPYPYVPICGVDLPTFINILIAESAAEGVNAEVVYAQMMLETRYLNFGGDVKVGQYNFAGIGATGGGEPGWSFPDITTGIRAQVQHLKAYASALPLNQTCVDPRFTLVTRGCAPTVQGLSQKWATGADYGNSIMAIIADLKSR